MLPLLPTTKKFVIAKRDINLPDGSIIAKDAVGIIEKQNDTSADIFFVRTWQKVNLPRDDFEVFDVTKTGDEFPKKICNICHKLIATPNFARNQNNINRPVRRPSCQDCRKTLEGIKPNPSEKARWSRANPKPDNEPFECPICGKRTIAGITCNVVQDHNHRTGKIRGWICDSCNTGIGRFKDNTELMQRAIKYVK